jgi:hypothetical protein
MRVDYHNGGRGGRVISGKIMEVLADKRVAVKMTELLGEPGQRFLRDVPNVRNQEHAWEIVRDDALRGFGRGSRCAGSTTMMVLHSVTPQPEGYVSQGFRRKVSP